MFKPGYFGFGESDMWEVTRMSHMVGLVEWVSRIHGDPEERGAGPGQTELYSLQ